MFERFTEKARRAVFFARYEASQYGSPHIETEHLLLGVCRENRTLRAILKDAGTDSELRREVERHITRGARISTSTEVPLSADSKKILHFAAEEADRLAQRQIGTIHMLLGILRVADSLGARIANARGLNLEEFREKLAKSRDMTTVDFDPLPPSLPVLEEFLAGLKSQSAAYLMSFFAKRAQIVDVHGKQWTYDELAPNFESVFAPYAKKNATYVIEETLADTNDRLVAVVLWKNALVASMERVWMHRMTVVLVPRDEWTILSIHVTPVQH